MESGTAGDAWRSLWVYTLATGELAKVSPDGLNVWEAAWCGPGHVLAITSGKPGEDDWYSAVLSRLDIATGAVTELLRSDVQLGLPAGTPDGTRAAVVEAVCSDRLIVAGDLILLDLVAGTRCAVDTAGTDVTAVQWIDGTRLGYAGQRHLDCVAGLVEAGAGPLPAALVAKELAASAQSWASGFYPGGAFTADGRVVVVRDDYDQPQEVVIIGPGTDEVLASLAHPGTDYLRSVAGSATNVSWDAPDGTSIEGILCTPAGSGPVPPGAERTLGGPVGGLPAELGHARPGGASAGVPRVRGAAPEPARQLRAGPGSSPPRSWATWAARTPTTTCPASTRWSSAASRTRRGSARWASATAGICRPGWSPRTSGSGPPWPVRR